MPQHNEIHIKRTIMKGTNAEMGVHSIQLATLATFAIEVGEK